MKNERKKLKLKKQNPQSSENDLLRKTTMRTLPLVHRVTYPGGLTSSRLASVASRESLVSLMGGSAGAFPRTPPTLPVAAAPLNSVVADILTMLSHTNSLSSCRVGSNRLRVRSTAPSSDPITIELAATAELVTNIGVVLTGGGGSAGGNICPADVVGTAVGPAKLTVLLEEVTAADVAEARGPHERPLLGPPMQLFVLVIL